MPDGRRRRAATPPPQQSQPQPAAPGSSPAAPVDFFTLARGMSDEELLEAVEAVDTEHSHILPPRSVHDAMRRRANEESVFTVEGKTYSISKGELLAFLWRYFDTTYGSPTGEIAAFVAELRARQEAFIGTAVQRGLVSPDHDERELAVRKRRQHTDG